jgi:hypothetical protein
VNLQEGGSIGEMYRWYALIRDMLAFFITMAYSGRLLPGSAMLPNFRNALLNSPLSS